MADFAFDLSFVVKDKNVMVQLGVRSSMDKIRKGRATGVSPREC
jgi:hypothetical protein